MQPLSVPAKIILFGEHAVVYDQPAIAIPVSDLRVVAKFAPPAGNYLKIVGINEHGKQALLYPNADHHNPFSQIVKLTLDFLEKPEPETTIMLESEIPIASGLGSGAALSTIIARALSEFFNQELPLSVLNDIVYEVEKIHHGTPSGIDNTVIVYEKPIVFRRESPLIFIEQIQRPLTFLIADTGEKGLTHISVAAVKERVENHSARRIITAIGDLVEQALVAIQNGDLQGIGQLMVKNHALLQELTVSSQSLDQLVLAAMNAGAYGAKLSGGGRGGNMIALVDDKTLENTRDALYAAGAIKVYKTTLKGS